MKNIVSVTSIANVNSNFTHGVGGGTPPAVGVSQIVFSGSNVMSLKVRFFDAQNTEINALALAHTLTVNDGTYAWADPCYSIANAIDATKVMIAGAGNANDCLYMGISSPSFAIVTLNFDVPFAYSRMEVITWDFYTTHNFVYDMHISIDGGADLIFNTANRGVADPYIVLG